MNLTSLRKDIEAILQPAAGPASGAQLDRSPSPDAGDLSMWDIDVNAADDAPIQQNDIPPPAFQVDDIRTIHHPHTNKPNQIDAFDTYTWTVPTPPPVSEPPWKLWGSLTAFNLAEIMLRAALSNNEIDSLLAVIRTLMKEQTTLPFSNHKDVNDLWDKASKKLTCFKSTPVTVPFEGHDETFEFWHRPLWGWLNDIITDPQIAPLLAWDAIQLSKYNGDRFVRFVHEPWTADHWWEVQSALPEDGKPLCLLLYADKTKLSSFGSQKAYPIMAQCMNLPSSTRHGDGPGGGRVVGWLPIIKEDEKSKNKKAYVDWKNAVWHKSFEVLLDSLKEKAEKGVDVECGDGKRRKLYPVILVLSADYEEQCTMALIRGSKGLKPCPVCLVPKKAQANHSRSYPLRTKEDSMNAVQNARAQQLLKDQEAILQRLGLRNVDNVFWMSLLCDPYRVLSWDRLHNYPAGLGGKHIWPDLKHCVEQLGKPMLALLDSQMAAMPRWPGLSHFSKVVSIDFSDASKWEDLLKVLLFASHNILTRVKTKHGYALLGCLRSYINLDTYAGMQVHTDETIAAGRLELRRFSQRFREFGKMFGFKPTRNGVTPALDVNYPKSHMHAHLFDDIQNKGVTLNYTTKVNERLHGDLKNSYHYRTNFRDVEEQILRIDHYLYTARHLRNKINHLPPEPAPPASLPQPGLEPGLGSSISNIAAPKNDQPQKNFGRVILGAPQRPKSFRDLEANAVPNDLTLHNLQQRVSRVLTWFLPKTGTALPPGQLTLDIQPHANVTEYRYLKTSFESFVTWQETEDSMRCNPNFNGQPRYDWVIYCLQPDSMAFGRLKFIFTYKVTEFNLTIPLAVIEPYDIVPPARIKDKDLELLRLRHSSSPRAHIDNIIPVESIIRGAYVVPEFDREDEWHVVDVIDDDMFLRLRSQFPAHFPSPIIQPEDPPSDTEPDPGSSSNSTWTTSEPGSDVDDAA